jgi:hypothetical protein
MPQISFQVNVATVEYKPKKNNPLNSSLAYPNQIEVNPYPISQGGGLAQSMMMPTNGGLGFESSADKGDEINLDEL